jgi:hypothetical protein
VAIMLALAFMSNNASCCQLAINDIIQKNYVKIVDMVGIKGTFLCSYSKYRINLCNNVRSKI